MGWPRRWRTLSGFPERRQNRNRAGDLAAFRKKRGPQAAHKLTGEVLAQAQRTLDEGYSQNAAAKEVGVSGAAISCAARHSCAEKMRGSQPRSAADEQCSGAVKRIEERALAGEEAPVRAAEAVPGAGVRLPALLQEGLRSRGGVGRGFFGLHSVMLTLAFMALLQKSRATQKTRAGRTRPAAGPRPGARDAAPQVEGDLRAWTCGADRFTRRWTEADPEALGSSTGMCAPAMGASTDFPRTSCRGGACACRRRPGPMMRERSRCSS